MEIRCFWLGLQIKLQKGWKVYWRTPGMPGFRPDHWTQSVNLGKQNYIGLCRPFRGWDFKHWDTKKRWFPDHGSCKDPITVKLHKLNYLTCDDVCIPYQAELSLVLPVGHALVTDHFQLISKFMAQVPGDGANHGLIEKVETAGGFNTVEKDLRKGIIRVVATSAVPFTKPDIFVEGPEFAIFSPPEVTLENGGKRAVLILTASEEGDAKIQNQLLTNLVDDGRAATQTHRVGAGRNFRNLLARRHAAAHSWSRLIGGLILNFMPCVAVLSQSVELCRPRRKQSGYPHQFLASSLGILYRFWSSRAAL